jgi:NAD(P)H-hydrate epimerase
VDIPSGMDSNSGKVLGTCLRANFTAAYCCAKPGHVLRHGPEFSGKIKIIDIGIPPEVLERAQITTELLDRKTASSLIQSIKRVDNVHKGSHGHMAILAGSSGKTGAAVLAAKGALRTGTGLVSLFAPKELNIIYESLILEAMTIPLPASTAYLTVNDLAFIKERLKGKRSIILGPGIGTEQPTADLVLDLYQSVTQPIVLDADALNILAKHRESPPIAAGPRIFTPHPGEMARLTGMSIEEIQDNRVQAARKACAMYSRERNDCVMVLKGAGTIITSSSGRTYINTSGNPGMATGGMGDVLTGIIAGLICQGLSCEAAAAAGVYLHGIAGDFLYDKQGFGYSASELEDNIPRSILQVLNDTP